MNKERLMRQFATDINYTSSKCMRIFAYFLIVYYLYFIFVLNLDLTMVSIVISICIVVAMIPSAVVFIFKKADKDYTKHIILICTVVLMTLLIVEFQQFSYAVILFPLLVASLYFNRTFVLFAAMLTSLGILLSAIILKYVPGVYIYNMAKHDDLFLNMAIPNIIIVISLSIIAFFIVDTNRNYVNKNIETAINMINNEKGLVFAFSELSENKSKFTGEHIKRVSEYMRVMAISSGFDEEYADKLATAAMMHDIGKLMISEEILDKPTKLTDEEYQIMKNHVLYGDALLEKCPGEIFHLARIMAREHHEKWNGKGYLGMKGTEIAYISRLLSVCDVFDALTAERMYKKGWDLQEAYDEIVRCSGEDFDPEAVKLFRDNFEKFKEIHDKYKDVQVY